MVNGWVKSCLHVSCCSVCMSQANPLVYFDISLDNNTPLGRITMELKVCDSSGTYIMRRAPAVVC